MKEPGQFVCHFAQPLHYTLELREGHEGLNKVPPTDFPTLFVEVCSRGHRALVGNCIHAALALCMGWQLWKSAMSSVPSAVLKVRLGCSHTRAL